jgi:hypothetical protein
MNKIVGLLVLLLALTVPIAHINAQMCAGTLYNNLIPGDTAVVITDNLLNVRSEPSVKGERITQLEPNTELFVTEGPICADGYSWYEVRLDYEQTGWVVESDHEDYWLGKLPNQYTDFERPADPNGFTPLVSFTYRESSLKRIDFDSAWIHGSSYSGVQIILRPLGRTTLGIFITPISFAEFEATPGGGADRAEVLRMLVEEWSDTALDMAYAYPNSQGDYPTFVVLKNLQEFQNGRGFSYIAAYIDEQEFQPIHRDTFWYVFHGMTDDGEYFVNVTMPIQPPQLPESPPQDLDDMTAYFEGYADWIDEIEAFLMTQNGASFSPMLGMVRGIIHSLEIN